MWRFCGPNLGTASCILRIFPTPQLSTAAYVSLTPEWINKKNILSFICLVRPSMSALVRHSSLSTFDTHSEQYRAIRINREKAFLTTHKDMTLNLTRSWICFDSPIFSFHHTVREGGEGRAEMVVRVETTDHSWVWLYMVLQLETGENPIVSNNYIIR